MNLLHALRTATRSLRRNPLRSVLTTLGIIIGTASVITLMEIGDGYSRKIMSDFGEDQARKIYVYESRGKRGSSTAGKVSTLTLEDSAAIAVECQAIGLAIPYLSSAGSFIVGNKNRAVKITGTTTDHFELERLRVLPGGRFFGPDEMREAAPVVIIGSEIQKDLFPGENALGRDIRINSTVVRVIGVIDDKSITDTRDRTNQVAFMPLGTVMRRISNGSETQNAFYGASGIKRRPESVITGNSAFVATTPPVPVRRHRIDDIVAISRSTGRVPEAVEQIKKLLHRRHRLDTGEADDFNVWSMDGFIERITNALTTASLFLLCIGGISLIVGGVGIMNIMLVTVTERTREIGLRMAVGAESRAILIQFLVESLMLCLLGGAIGIGLGRIVSWTIGHALGWPVQPSLGAIAASFTVSAAIGLVFGFYPALKASRLDPIEALRHE